MSECGARLGSAVMNYMLGGGGNVNVVNLKSLQNKLQLYLKLFFVVVFVVVFFSRRSILALHLLAVALWFVFFVVVSFLFFTPASLKAAMSSLGTSLLPRVSLCREPCSS